VCDRWVIVHTSKTMTSVWRASLARSRHVTASRPSSSRASVSLTSTTYAHKSNSGHGSLRQSHYIRAVQSDLSTRLLIVLNHFYTRCTELKTEKLGKEIIRKEIRFEAVLKNSQRWSWGEIRWQTVPETAPSHRKRTIINSGQPWMRGWWWQLESAMVMVMVNVNFYSAIVTKSLIRWAH